MSEIKIKKIKILLLTYYRQLWIGIKRSVLNFECAALCDLAFSSGWFGKDVFAVVAIDDWLSMAEDYVSLTASSTLDIHEVWVRSWDESFKLMGVSFVLNAWVK